jgi:ribonuclease PH
MNVVMKDGAAFVEIQGTAEGHAFRRDELDALLALAADGIARLHEAQAAALATPLAVAPAAAARPAPKKG